MNSIDIIDIIVKAILLKKNQKIPFTSLTNLVFDKFPSSFNQSQQTKNLIASFILFEYNIVNFENNMFFVSESIWQKALKHNEVLNNIKNSSFSGASSSLYKTGTIQPENQKIIETSNLDLHSWINLNLKEKKGVSVSDLKLIRGYTSKQLTITDLEFAMLQKKFYYILKSHPFYASRIIGDEVLYSIGCCTLIKQEETGKKKKGNGRVKPPRRRKSSSTGNITLNKKKSQKLNPEGSVHQ